jgi:hypothetical protein
MGSPNTGSAATAGFSATTSAIGSSLHFKYSCQLAMFEHELLTALKLCFGANLRMLKKNRVPPTFFETFIFRGQSPKPQNMIINVDRFNTITRTKTINTKVVVKRNRKNKQTYPSAMIFKDEEIKQILPAHRKLPNSEYSKTSL